MTIGGPLRERNIVPARQEASQVGKRNAGPVVDAEARFGGQSAKPAERDPVPVEELADNQASRWLNNARGLGDDTSGIRDFA